jgi:hypothetical protein
MADHPPLGRQRHEGLGVVVERHRAEVGPEAQDPAAVGDDSRERLAARRAELGLPAGDDAPLVVDPASGRAVAEADVELHLRRARLTKMSLDTNGAMCRDLLHRRYPEVVVQLGAGHGRAGAPSST